VVFSGSLILSWISAMHFSWALKFDQDMHIADESKTVERHEQNAAALSWRLPHAATVRL